MMSHIKRYENWQVNESNANVALEWTDKGGEKHASAGQDYVIYKNGYNFTLNVNQEQKCKGSLVVCKAMAEDLEKKYWNDRRSKLVSQRKGWTDPAGGHHDDNEDDPAKMYESSDMTLAKEKEVQKKIKEDIAQVKEAQAKLEKDPKGKEKIQEKSKLLTKEGTLLLQLGKSIQKEARLVVDAQKDDKDEAKPIL